MKKIIIIGAGASGVVAAINAKNENNEVIVLEKNNFALKKVLITGAGRCNYFNDFFDVSKYNTDHEIVKKVINYKNEYLSFFNNLGIYPNVINGYYYPYSNSAVSIQNALLMKAKEKNIKFIYDYPVKNIRIFDNKYVINEEYIADKLIISTGSKAYPKTGSTGEMYDILKSLNINILPVLPALVQLESDNKICKKWPVSRVKAKVSLLVENEALKENEGEVQLTDYGISGVCTLNISGSAIKNLTAGKEVFVLINFLSFIKNYDEFIISRLEILKNRNVVEFFEGIVNYKLLIALLDYYKIDKNLLFEDLSDNEKEKVKNILTNFKLKIDGYKDFSNSQVCQGGISLDELTLDFEVKKHKNMFITGEILDVDGQCGGYNLSFAFISGMVAGKKAGNND